MLLVTGIAGLLLSFGIAFVFGLSQVIRGFELWTP